MFYLSQVRSRGHKSAQLLLCQMIILTTLFLHFAVVTEPLSSFPSPGSLVLSQLSTSSDANPEGSSNVGNKMANAQDHHFPRDVGGPVLYFVTIILCSCASLK